MATHVSDGSDLDVQDIHDNDVVTGDTITIPAGAFIWTTTVTITKGITLQGAGSTLSSITDVGGSGAALTATCNGTTVVRVTGLEFIKYTPHANGMVQFYGTSNAGVEEEGFRIDHCKFTFPTAGGRGIYVYWVYGLIDNNEFVVGGPGSQQVISVDGSSISANGGFSPWGRPLSLGTANAVYIEDNTLDFTGNDQSEDAIDIYSGARVVVRYNTFLSCTQGFHGTDSGGIRSPVSFEVYNNTYTNNSGTTIRACTVRGGTGVFFGNTYGGSHGTWNPITMQYFRAYSQQSDWEQCDGTVWQLGSMNLSTDASRTCSESGGIGFNSVDKETLGTFGGSFTRGFDGTGTNGYPGRDQPGMAPGQVLTPIYIWDQTNDPGVDIWAGSLPPSVENTLLQGFLQEDREWILAEHPTYTAYEYPHPLQGGEVVPPEPGTSSEIAGVPVY